MVYAVSIQPGEMEFTLARPARPTAKACVSAVDILEANDSHPEAEIDRVTTPGGLTIKGLNAMEAAGFTPSVIEGLRASTKR